MRDFAFLDEGTPMVASESFAALWPGGESAVTPISPAPRLDTLDGKRIAFLWDAMFRGDEIFPMLAEQLSKHCKGATFISHEEFGATFGGDEHAVLEALPQLLEQKNVDAVIGGNGC
ncbi:MAG: hypothetical protein HOI95_18590 [Chromatiales bacterium]|mgnify:FL=1|jgi:hypothetical protein|nr:hypothetical protein [Chromatiales bacterium]